MGEPAEHAEPIIDRDDDHAALGEALPVVHRFAARARPTARRRRSRRRPARFRVRGRPDVERQAVLAHRHRLFGIDVVELATRADCTRAPNSVASRTPSQRAIGYWRLPAQRADRRFGERNALEHADAVLGRAADGAGRRANDLRIVNRAHGDTRLSENKQPAKRPRSVIAEMIMREILAGSCTARNRRASQRKMQDRDEIERRRAYKATSAAGERRRAPGNSRSRRRPRSVQGPAR